MKEFPDYYERLERMEKEAEREWAEKHRAGEGSRAPRGLGGRMAYSPECLEGWNSRKSAQLRSADLSVLATGRCR
jgi:hypothetical protein